ncbi:MULTISPECIES: DNA methyltransferase [Aminobacterium]|jgi:predicted methyltransferase|uniref:DNA methyltransferase n=1 Tax=Aminobacterium TaxID=81466 RepID=UPI00257B182D|nr:DNA methyltransferase [Aminobacterium sp. UBA4987]
MGNKLLACQTNTILCGDALSMLSTFSAESIDCCITSPPYFGMRNYNVDGQIGLEGTPEKYISRLVNVFQEVFRVLKKTGTVWLNLADSYGSYGGDTYSNFNKRWSDTGGEGSKQNNTLHGVTTFKKKTGLRPKNLLGIPWRDTLALGGKSNVVSLPSLKAE